MKQLSAKTNKDENKIGWDNKQTKCWFFGEKKRMKVPNILVSKKKKRNKKK